MPTTVTTYVPQSQPAGPDHESQMIHAMTRWNLKGSLIVLAGRQHDGVRGGVVLCSSLSPEATPCLPFIRSGVPE